MRWWIVHIALSLLVSLPGLTQNPDIEEDIFLHLSSADLVTGETLYFSAYVISRKTGQLSPLSALLYVELVGENGSIHQQQVGIVGGRGQGAFFASSLIPTSRYQLIAYTRWSRNFHRYFRAPLLIINPFEEYPRIQDASSTEILVDFHPVGGKLVAGLPNEVVVQVQGIDGPVNGRLVADGQTLDQMETDKAGLGTLKFEAPFDAELQFVLEVAEGELKLFDLPPYEGGPLLHLEDRGDHFQITCSTTAGTGDYAKLLVTNPGETLRSREITLNSPTVIRKSALHGESLSFQVWTDEERLLCTQQVPFDYPKIKRHGSILRVGSGQVASLSVDLPRGHYSAVIHRKSATEAELPWAVAQTWQPELHLYRGQVLPYLEESSSRSIKELAVVTRSLGQPTDVAEISRWPEHRDALLDGRLLDAEGRPMVEHLIALSTPGDDFQLRFARTTSNGKFSIPYQPQTEESIGYLNTWPVKRGVSIEVEDPYLDAYPAFDHEIPALDSAAIAVIVDRSIRNQIENAYFVPEVVRESKLTLSPPFRSTLSYNLDDYTRFATIQETFTEIIVGANVRENRTPIFKTYDNSPFENKHAPLILLDGVPVDAQSLLSLSAYRIESIGLVRNRFFLGPGVFDGVVHFTTREGALGGFNVSSTHVPVVLPGLPEVREPQETLNPTETHLPDQRLLLHWDPNLHVRGDPCEISFLASDVPGDYELIVQGFDRNGTPVTYIREIEVRN